MKCIALEGGRGKCWLFMDWEISLLGNLLGKVGASNSKPGTISGTS